MLTLIFALAVRLVARVGGAVAARLSHFPAVSLPGTLAGKIFSLPAGSGKMAQRFDVTQKFRSHRCDFGAETKIFPAVSRSAGKIALAGVHPPRIFAAPPLARRRRVFANNSGDPREHLFGQQHEGLMAEWRAHQIVEPDLFA